MELQGYDLPVIMISWGQYSIINVGSFKAVDSVGCGAEAGGINSGSRAGDKIILSSKLCDVVTSCGALNEVKCQKIR